MNNELELTKRAYCSHCGRALEEYDIVYKLNDDMFNTSNIDDDEEIYCSISCYISYVRQNINDFLDSRDLVYNIDDEDEDYD